ncbi:MAG: pknD [Cyanobacteria bacterium RYN_339]|nr:pknD [Cyanobacteria bacterium RYN_339]
MTAPPGPGRTAGGALALALLVVGCTVNAPKLPKATATATPAVLATTGPTAARSATPGPVASQPATSTAFGHVLGLDGRPAAGVQVRAYILSDASAGVIANNGGNVIANNGGNVIANNGGGWHLLDTGLVALTDADGGFPELKDPQGRPVNLEAVQQDNVKAITFGIKPGAGGVTLQLAHTGTITGKVTAAKAGGVTNFLGVDVFVPGTSYLAKTDAAGAYTIANVPVGSFSLVASKTGLGSANANGVKVSPDATVQAPDLDLSTVPPVITSLAPTAAGPGAEVTLTGDHFGATEGVTFTVSLGGGLAINPRRVDDHTIVVKLPDAAASGALSVSVGGIESNAVHVDVFAALFLPPALRTLRAGAKLPLVALAKDTTGAVAPANVTWTATGAATVEGGQLVAGNAGEGSLTAKSGNLSVTMPFKVYPDGPLVGTIAGDVRLNGQGFGDIDGPGAAARFTRPGAMVVDPAGVAYVAALVTHKIRKVTANGLVSTLAGNGTSGNADGVGADARFHDPQGIARDAQGNLLVADTGNNLIRKVTPAGRVTTFAGDGTLGVQDGPAAQARFNHPDHLAFDPAGNLLVLEASGTQIRKVAPDGTVSTLLAKSASGFKYANDLAVDAGGNLFLTDSSIHQIWRVTPDGKPAPFTLKGTTLTLPSALAVDPHGNLIVMDVLKYYDASGSDTRVLLVKPDGTATVLGTNKYTHVDGPLGTAGFSRLICLTYTPGGELWAFDDDDVDTILRRITGLPSP